MLGIATTRGENSPVIGQPDLATDLVRTGLQDQEAFRRLYDASAPHLLAIALSIVGERRTAESILQDVFVETWGRAREFDPVRHRPIKWLHAITRRRSIEWRRSHIAGRKSFSRRDGSTSISRLESGLRPTNSLGATESGALLKSLFVQGLNYSEAADHAGVSEMILRAQVRTAILNSQDVQFEQRSAENPL